MICNIKGKIFYSFLTIYNLTIIALIFNIPYTKIEDKILLKGSFLTNIFASELYTLTDSYIFVRLIFFCISIVSIYLIYQISFFYLKSESFSVLSTAIFILTPGVFVSFIIINYATLTIFLLLLFIYSYINSKISLQIVSMVLLFFTNTAIFIFYLSLIIYSYFQKNKKLFIFAFIFFILSIFKASYSIDGIPKGYLIELFTTYAITLSPLYFLALLYAIYRLAKDKNFSILWYISSFALVVSLLLSIRQKILVTDFTPFIVIASPLVVLVYKNSISIRLKQFQKWHKLICRIVILTIFLESFLIALSYPIYKVTNKKIKIINSRIYTIKKENKFK